MSKEKLFDYEMTLKGGEPIGDFKLTQENFEQLKMLKLSPQWKLYSKILSVVQSGYVQCMYPMEQSNQISKTLGIVVGLNLASSQLDALLKDYELKQARLVRGGPKNHGRPEPKSGGETV